MDVVLELKNVTKRFGNVVALNSVTFNVRKGQFFGYLGPDGAGKTTTIRIMIGLLKPDEGTVRLFGEDPYSDEPKSLETRRRIGVVLEKPGHLSHISVYRNLLYHGKIYKLENIHERITRLLKQFNLWKWRNIHVEVLSEGMKRKLAIARALLNDPELLIFDEPTLGLDPNAQLEIRRLLRKIARMGKTMFFSSSDLHEVQEMCSHLAIINKGRIIVCDELKRLRRKYVVPVINVKLHSKMAGNREFMKELCEEIKTLGFVRDCRIEGEGALQVELEDPRFSSRLNEFFVRKKLPILGFKKETRSLEDLYTSLVKESD